MHLEPRSLLSLAAVTTALALANGCSAPDTAVHTGKDTPEPASGAVSTSTNPSPVSVPTGGALASPPRLGADDLAQKLRAVDANVYRIPAQDLPSLGSANALVTIVFFSDYECPFCHRLEGELTRLRTEYGDDVRIVFAPRPLMMHPRARPAALAAIAANAQGKFAEMHHRLNEGKLDDDSIKAAATAIGLDMARFEADRAGPEAEKILVRVDELATRFSMFGTPNVFINGRRISGAQRDLVRRVTEDQLASARALLATGVDRRQIYETITGKGLESAGRDPSMMLLPRFAPSP
jgi:protein-disulfide isomerase